MLTFSFSLQFVLSIAHEFSVSFIFNLWQRNSTIHWIFTFMPSIITRLVNIINHHLPPTGKKKIPMKKNSPHISFLPNTQNSKNKSPSPFVFGWGKCNWNFFSHYYFTLFLKAIENVCLIFFFSFCCWWIWRGVN